MRNLRWTLIALFAALFSPAMTIEQLADELGDEPDPAAFWPVARIPLPPDLYQPWIEMVAEHDGESVEAFRTLMSNSGR